MPDASARAVAPPTALAVAPTPAASPRGDRAVWMDVLRGGLVLLVVLAHVLAEAERLGVEHPPYVLVALSTVFAPLRMPAMALLSGMLLHASLAKGPRAHLEGKVRHLLWPYVVWSVVYVACWTLAPSWVPSGHGALDLLAIAWAPLGVLWFIHHLFCYYVAMLVLHRAPPLLVAASAFALSVAFTHDRGVKLFFFLFAFFVLGDLVARHADRAEAVLADRRTLPVCVVLASPLLGLGLLAVHTRYEATFVPFVGAAIVLLALGAAWLVGTRLGGALAWLGHDSLVVYVVHWLAVAVALNTLRTWDVLADRPSLLVPATLVAAVAVSAAAVWGRRSLLGVPWLFGWPGRPREHRVAAPA